MTATEELVGWAHGLDADDVREEVAEAIALHAIDGVGCALAAWRMGEGGAAVEVATRYGAPADAVVIGTDRRVAAPWAAFANGVLIHALDNDDTHPGALVHPTSVLLPAALAVAQRDGSTPGDVVLALAAGYEAMTRLGAAVPHGFHARGFHATSVCGVFAATLVAARLCGLSVAGAVNALGIAGSMVAGSLEFLATGSDTKQLHPGLAAQAAVTATDLAAAGARGPASILEGDAGLFALYAGTHVDGPTLFAGLGAPTSVCDVAIKRYPVCQLSQPSLDALHAVMPVDIQGIDQVVVRIPRSSIPIVAEPRDAKIRPRSAYEAKFSLAWCASLLLIDGSVNVDSFADVARVDVADLAGRIRIEPAETTAPPATVDGDVEIRFHDSSRRVCRAPATRPVTVADVVDKFAANAGLSVDEAIAMLTHDAGLNRHGLSQILGLLPPLARPVTTPC